MGNTREIYGDIIDLPHHISETRPRMSRANRAAQFSPFAALTGYDDLVSESARETEARRELTEAEKAELDLKLRLLQRRIDERSRVTITYFEQDTKKAGGRYAKVSGEIKRINRLERSVLMASGEEIGIEDIFGISGNLFCSM